MEPLQFKQFLLDNNIPFDGTDDPLVISVDEEDLEPFYDKVQITFPDFKPYTLEQRENPVYEPKERTND